MNILIAVVMLPLATSCSVGEGRKMVRNVAVEDLTGYKNMQGMTVACPSIQNAQFEMEDNGWSLPEGYRYVKAEGRNGTMALCYERTDPSQYPLANQEVALTPGASYRFGAWIKTEYVNGEGGGGCICMETWKGDQFMGGIYSEGIKGTKDWTYIERVFTAQGGSGYRYTISIYLSQKMTGKVWFDDITIEPNVSKWSVYLIRPAYETIPSDNGEMVLGSFYQASDKMDANAMACHIQVESGGRPIRKMVCPVQKNRIFANLGRLPEGTVSLRLKLLETKQKWILSEETIPITAVSSKRVPPSNACLFDKKGRAIVDGKPFLPVGLYFGNFPRAEFERFWKSSFNCIMPYSPTFYITDGYSDPPPEEAILKTMDECQKHGTKVIYPLHTVYTDPTEKFTIQEWYGAKGQTAVVEKMIGLVKNHPALLAWYTCDERPLEMVPKLMAARRQINRLDPYHPTWAVFYQYSDLHRYSSCFDVLGFDCYPISEPTENQSIGKFVTAMESANFTGVSDGMPLWVVPQIFNWGNYKACNDPVAYKRDFRYPTEEEMRSMSLLSAIHGARGFIFYAYHDFFKPCLIKGDFERQWPQICQMATLVTSLAPFLLSDAAEPKMDVQMETGDVHAKGFADEQGRIRVLVTGIGPGDSRAVLTITSRKPLKSKYGHCVSIGKGCYRFEGRNICSDVLESD